VARADGNPPRAIARPPLCDAPGPSKVARGPGCGGRGRGPAPGAGRAACRLSRGSIHAITAVRSPPPPLPPAGGPG